MTRLFVLVLFVLVLAAASLAPHYTLAAYSNATAAEYAGLSYEGVEVVVFDSSDWYTLVYSDDCITVYAYNGPVTGSQINEFMDWMGTVESGVYLRVSYEEYLRVLDEINKTVQPLIENGTINSWTLEGRGGYGFSTISVSVPANASDLEAVGEAVASVLAPLMEKYNLTGIVLFLTPNLTHQSARPSVNWTTFSKQFFDIMFGRGLSDEALADAPGYLGLAWEVDREGRYMAASAVSMRDDGRVVLIRFHEPLPPPSQDDISEIARWIASHATPAMCGYTVLIATSVDEPVERYYSITGFDQTSPAPAGDTSIDGQPGNTTTTKQEGGGGGLEIPVYAVVPILVGAVLLAVWVLRAGRANSV